MLDENFGASFVVAELEERRYRTIVHLLSSHHDAAGTAHFDTNSPE